MPWPASREESAQALLARTRGPREEVAWEAVRRRRRTVIAHGHAAPTAAAADLLGGLDGILDSIFLDLLNDSGWEVDIAHFRQPNEVQLNIAELLTQVLHLVGGG